MQAGSILKDSPLWFYPENFTNERAEKTETLSALIEDNDRLKGVKTDENYLRNYFKGN